VLVTRKDERPAVILMLSAELMAGRTSKQGKEK
jgi:hypothetical protein